MTATTISTCTRHSPRAHLTAAPETRHNRVEEVGCWAHAAIVPHVVVHGFKGLSVGTTRTRMCIQIGLVRLSITLFRRDPRLEGIGSRDIGRYVSCTTDVLLLPTPSQYGTVIAYSLFVTRLIICYDEF